MSRTYDYYHRHADGGERRREDRLPPIHYVVGDPFERRHSPYDLNDVKRSLPRVTHDPYAHPAISSHVYGQQGPTLAPIRTPTHVMTSHSTSFSKSRPTRDRDSSYKTSYRSPPRMNHIENQHGVFQALYPSKSGNLVTVSTSSSPQGILRSTELPDEGDYDPKKRYVCPDCGKRFDRPSGLDQHRLKHTGERPYSCPISGCQSTFTVRSNMTRHLRTQHGCEPEDLDDRHRSPRHSTRTSTLRSPSDSHYISSRHR